MKIKSSEAAKKAQEADKKRKEKSSRKGENTIYRDYTMDEIKAMSAAKRRNLQDKGVIPKGLNF